jgi:hypothetical protein
VFIDYTIPMPIEKVETFFEVAMALGLPTGAYAPENESPEPPFDRCQHSEEETSGFAPSCDLCYFSRDILKNLDLARCCSNYWLNTHEEDS